MHLALHNLSPRGSYHFATANFCVSTAGQCGLTRACAALQGCASADQGLSNTYEVLGRYLAVWQDQSRKYSTFLRAALLVSCRALPFPPYLLIIKYSLDDYFSSPWS